MWGPSPLCWGQHIEHKVPFLPQSQRFKDSHWRPCFKSWMGFFQDLFCMVSCLCQISVKLLFGSLDTSVGEEEIIPEYSLEGLMLELKLQHFGHLMWRADSLEKTLMLGGTEGGRGREGMTEDKTVGRRHRWLSGRGSERTRGAGDGQGGLARCGPRGHREPDTTERPSNSSSVDTEPVWSLSLSLCPPLRKVARACGPSLSPPPPQGALSCLCLFEHRAYRTVHMLFAFSTSSSARTETCLFLFICCGACHSMDAPTWFYCPFACQWASGVFPHISTLGTGAL